MDPSIRVLRCALRIVKILRSIIMVVVDYPHAFLVSGRINDILHISRHHC